MLFNVQARRVSRCRRLDAAPPGLPLAEDQRLLDPKYYYAANGSRASPVADEQGPTPRQSVIAVLSTPMRGLATKLFEIVEVGES
jgi:hypothetical protein